MATLPISKYEIPTEAREFAENSVAEARKAFAVYAAAAGKAVTAFESTTEAAQDKAKSVGKKAISYAEANISASFSFAERIVRAKDMEEITQLQVEFARAQIASLTQQAKELSQAVSEVRVPS